MSRQFGEGATVRVVRDLHLRSFTVRAGAIGVAHTVHPDGRVMVITPGPSGLGFHAPASALRATTPGALP